MAGGLELQLLTWRQGGARWPSCPWQARGPDLACHSAPSSALPPPTDPEHLSEPLRPPPTQTRQALSDTAPPHQRRDTLSDAGVTRE
ncbi:hypothetical protein T484DRAFT_2253898 [Baffinella frigidus]|nr:hypothetical protein T484DRAFT_2253898 [Cryptophyta sp. CCMP2293]